METPHEKPTHGSTNTTPDSSTNESRWKLTAADKLELLGIKGCQYAYYCLGETFMIDYDFDQRFKRFDQKFPGVIPIGSARDEDYTQAEKAYAKLFLGKYEAPDEDGFLKIRKIR